MTLSVEHLDQLAVKRGIAESVIAERGYRTCTGHSELKSLGIGTRKNEAEGLLIPLWSPDGTPATYVHVKEQREVPYTVFRPDVPLIAANGKERKYLNPTATPTRIDCHPRCHDLIRDAGTFLWLTEGIPKGDALVTHGACALAFLGVQSWRGAEWADVQLKGREVGIVYDSDVMVKQDVQRALTGLTEYLTMKGAHVWHVSLPHEDNGKVGIDDFLAQGHSLADVEALLVDTQQAEASKPAQSGWQSTLTELRGGTHPASFRNLKLCVANSSEAANLWWDLVADRPMVGNTPLAEEHVERAAFEIEEHIEIVIHKLDPVRTALLAHCREHKRDPIREWLEALTWDKQPRLLTWLPTYTGAPKTTYINETGRLWVVSMVARGLHPGCQSRSVLVLMGAQDIGKSALVKIMATEPWYRDVSTSLEGKEAHIILKGTWLIELGELSGMSKTEESRLKSFITMANDAYIPKYSNDPIKQARRTILVGTCNPEGDKTFLRDQTGATRYYPVPVTAINLEAIDAIREQLFAEALVYYRDHPKDWWRLSPGGEAQAREIREDHRVRGVYEEALGNWLETTKQIKKPGGGVEWEETCWEEICTKFLLLEAKEKWKDTRLQKEISQAMVANGWEQGKQKRLKGYGQVRPWGKKPT
jgi:predicted P-loop ATPase